MVHELASPRVPVWGHLELPERQEGLEQCLSLSTLRAGSHLYFSSTAALPVSLC